MADSLASGEESPSWVDVAAEHPSTLTTTAHKHTDTPFTQWISSTLDSEHFTSILVQSLKEMIIQELKGTESINSNLTHKLFPDDVLNFSPDEPDLQLPSSQNEVAVADFFNSTGEMIAKMQGMKVL